MLLLVTVILTMWVSLAKGQAISCSLPQIPNGEPTSPKASYQDNERLQYRCLPGYSYSGRAETVCTQSGWTPPPSCQEMSCDPPRIANSHFVADRSTYRLGDTIRYSCKGGFFPSSRGNTTKCTDIGWDPPPRCSYKPCEFPEIKHGSLHWGDWYRSHFPVSAGQWYHYFCDDNYVTPSGSKWDRMTCTRDGWTPEVPCRRKCIFNDLENGHRPQYEQSYLQGTSVSVNCYPGYTLQNKQTKMTCTENGWLPLPRCIRVVTCLKSKAKIENGFIAEPVSTYLLNQRVKYKCKQDYVTEDGHTSGYITCLQNGWSAQPRCIKSCGVPVFENARARSDGTWFKVNDRLAYECQDGYKNRDGHTVGSIVCGDNGWSDTPSCQAMTCSSPPSYDNAILMGQPQNSYKSGEQVAYRCTEHYQMDGSNIVQCMNGRWIGTPTCKEICLKSEARIENGFIAESESTYPLNKKTNYKCKEGYVTEDGHTSGYITCLQNGWSAQPRCIKLCDMPIFENATALITGRPFRPNDTLDYQCLDGYENRDGSTNGSMVCGEGGWSHLPTCFKSADKCGPPPAISDGDITSFPLEGYPPGSRVEYQCQAYYELRGPRYVTCSYAKWSEPPRCIDPCVISEEIMNEKNIQLKGKDNKRYYVKTGDIIDFMCKSGHNAVTSEESFQAVCREGAVEFPRYACVVSEEILRKYNIQLRWLDVRNAYFTVEDYIEFVCQPSCSEVPPPSAFQVPCQEGELEYSTYEQDDSYMPGIPSDGDDDDDDDNDDE